METGSTDKCQLVFESKSRSWWNYWYISSWWKLSVWTRWYWHQHKYMSFVTENFIKTYRGVFACNFPWESLLYSGHELRRDSLIFSSDFGWRRAFINGGAGRRQLITTHYYILISLHLLLIPRNGPSSLAASSPVHFSGARSTFFPV